MSTDLPTARLRQLRDGHDPDDAQHGRARTNRIGRLQQQIVDCDEMAVELERYRQAGWQINVRPAVRRLVDREIRRLIDDETNKRGTLEHELRAKQ